MGTPYVLFKAKNVTDPRRCELKSGARRDQLRPIAPTFSHPMKALLHIAGKAWYFLVKNMGGEHFIINSTGDVPALLRGVMAQFEGDELEARVLDIAGCLSLIHI